MLLAKALMVMVSSLSPKRGLPGEAGFTTSAERCIRATTSGRPGRPLVAVALIAVLDALKPLARRIHGVFDTCGEVHRVRFVNQVSGCGVHVCALHD
jgi:hypothetical protein